MVWMDRTVLVLLGIVVAVVIVSVPSFLYLLNLSSDNNSEDRTRESFHSIELNLRFTPAESGQFNIIVPAPLHEGDVIAELIEVVKEGGPGFGMANSAKGLGFGVNSDKPVDISLLKGIERSEFDYGLSLENENNTYNFFSTISGFIEYRVEIFQGNQSVSYIFIDNLYHEWTCCEQI